MVYWHADENALCVYAQLKTCSSSEVGPMLKGLLQHWTKMEINQVRLPKSRLCSWPHEQQHT
jgi:TnpA family transposase